MRDTQSCCVSNTRRFVTTFYTLPEAEHFGSIQLPGTALCVLKLNKKIQTKKQLEHFVSLHLVLVSLAPPTLNDVTHMKRFHSVQIVF